MTIYLLNLFLIILFSIIIKSKKKYVILISIQLFLILACRNVELGVDLPNYQAGFNYIKSLDFLDMLSRLNFIDIARLRYPFSYESGYVILNWIVSNLGINFHGFLIICALINIVSIGYFVYKYSDMPWLSFFILCTFGTFTYFFGIIRQSLALSFFLWSIHFAIENKKIKSLLFFMFAFLNHRAVVIMLPLYLFLKRDVLSRKKIIILFLCSIPFFAMSNFIYSNVISIIMAFFGKGYQGHSMQLNNLLILLYVISFIVIITLNFKKIEKNKMVIISIIALIISLYVEIIGLYNDNFARSVQMYNAFLLINIPCVVKQYNSQKIVLMIKLIIIIALTLLYIYTLNGSEIVPYEIQTSNFFFG